MRVVIMLCLGMYSLPMFSQAIVTDRPDQTEASSTVPKGSFQLESGLLLTTYDDGASSFAAPSNLIRYGLTSSIELRLFHQVEKLTGGDIIIDRGMNDIEVGTKVQILKKEDVNTEIAFLSHLILPTGAPFISNDKFGTINKLSIAHELNEKAGIGYNIGYNNFGYGIGDFTYSVALGYSLSDKFGLYVEPFGELLEFKSHYACFDAGFTYLAKDNLQLDISYGLGLNHDMTYYSLGFSWNIGSTNSEDQ